MAFRRWIPGSKIALGRILFFLAVLAVAAAIGLTRHQTEAACVPDTFPSQWLEAQEEEGGHTIERHVGKSDDWLIDRLETQPRIPAASSFLDLTRARLSVRTALTRNRRAINRWAENAAERAKRAWVYDGATIIGRVALRPSSSRPNGEPIVGTTDVKVVVVADGAGGCMLLTAYPNPE